MGGKELSVSTQEFFGFCRKGSFEQASQWINQKTKKSKLNFLRPTTPNVGWLANLRDPTTGYTVLHFAALNGHMEIVQLLVEQDGQLLTSKDRRGCLPLHLAAWNGHNQVVQYLLEAEISTIDTVNNAKETALHLAAQHGHGKVVAILLQKQANPRLRNARFENPLDIAARTGKENVCRLLICHCPELALQSAAECSRADNKTISQHIVYPLHVAARHGHIECLRVFCESGFDVNYVTEEGTALHVAALFGQVEAVKLLLKYGVDHRIKDSQGKTVLEKLEEHETQKATDLTQIIQSREGWSECRRLIEQYIKGVKPEINGNQIESEDKEVVWRTLPENSLAVNNQNSHTSSQRISSTSSNGGIYYPPSMTVEHVVFDNDDDNHASTITLSTNPQDLNTSFNESSGGENQSNSSSISPSVNSTSSHVKVIPKFPVTSPNAKTRHANTRRFGNPVTINGVEPKLVQLPLNNESPCTYQPPPQYETWLQVQNRGASYDNINLGTSNGSLNHSYRNIPQPYDNAPLESHRRWEHACQNHGVKNEQKPGFKNGTVGVSNGKNYSKSNQVIREDGTQTIPAVKLTPSRPTILNGIFAQTILEHPERSELPPTLPPKPRLKDSKSTEFSHPHRSTGVTFASSTLDRSISPDRAKSKDLQGKAPLALPEEIGGSTCTSLVSNSPERILNPIDERLRRSITTNSEDRTLISMHEDYLPKFEKNKLDSTMDKSTHSLASGNIMSPNSVGKPTSSAASGNITSPQSDTVESSCSLPQISQLSSSSSTRPCSSEMLDKSDSPNAAVVLRDKTKPRLPSQPSTIAEIDQVEEWKKIEEILSAIRRDSFFAETNNSQVAVSVRNRKSQALTLQLSSVNPTSARQSNLSYPSEPEDLKNMLDRPLKDSKQKARNEIEEWLNTRVGLPMARSAEISTILNRNGFDQAKFLKGSLSHQAMTEMEIDKSIQHQISIFLQEETCQIPSIEEFDYASDWLSALQLIDYLEFFAMKDLTQVKKIIANDITKVDLKLMGISLIGHIERIQKSLHIGNQSTTSSSFSIPQSSANSSSAKIQSSSSTLHHDETSEEKSDPENSAKWEEKTELLLRKFASYSAHYLGSAEISNVEGAEDCRRAMNVMKSRIRQINKVPQVLLEISVNGVNVLDSTSNRLTVQHEISKIQVVCQDELDLNCFAYIFQDGEKNFCHVYCVLTAEMARDIIMTLGHAFNLAYNLATGNAGQ